SFFTQSYRTDLVAAKLYGPAEVRPPDAVVQPVCIDGNAPCPFPERRYAGCPVIRSVEIECAQDRSGGGKAIDPAVLEVGNEKLAVLAVVADVPQGRTGVRQAGENAD